MQLADQLVTNARDGKPRPFGYRCEILNTPEDTDTVLRIKVPGLSGEHQWRCRRWLPHGTDLPIEGDQGLAIPDDRGELHLLAWYPESDA